ncbi:MAG: hypothetical protein HYW86_02040 [Candidatus Roizmanbacteria bacterium]|nr:MAG: hypothetical protein HYW86_02040 [Candidatus Roizmanbacteria bacterium]
MDPQTQPQINPEPTVSPQPSSKLPLIIAGLVLVLVVGAGSYYFGQRSVKVTKENVSTNSTVSPTIKKGSSITIENTDETSSWKKYKSSKYGYSFKYPENWILSKPDDEVQNFYLNQAFADRGGPGGIFSVVNLEKELMELNVNSKDPIGTRKETGDKIFVTKVQNINLDGKSGFRYKQEVMSGSQTDAQPEIGAFVNLENKAIKITLPLVTNVNPLILDQILSTFRFDELTTSKFAQ